MQAGDGVRGWGVDAGYSEASVLQRKSSDTPSSVTGANFLEVGQRLKY
jgi:hypothetical protein